MPTPTPTRTASDTTTGLYLESSASNQIVSLKTTLTVPAEPPASGTLFLWPGLQPNGANFYPIGNGVLQPVLTWGPSCAPGTQPKAYSTWWVSGQYVNTDPNGTVAGHIGCNGGPIMPVSVGDALTMTMTLNGTTWTQSVLDVQTRKSVSYAIDMDGQTQNVLFFISEGYVQNPVGSVAFSSTTLTFSSAAPPGGCNLLPLYYGTPDSKDTFTTPVVSNAGKTCYIAHITLYSPSAPFPAGKKANARGASPPVSGQGRGKPPGANPT